MKRTGSKLSKMARRSGKVIRRRRSKTHKCKCKVCRCKPCKCSTNSKKTKRKGRSKRR